MIVMKFGGTSVETADRIRRSAALVADYADDQRIVVVVSALAKITDQILACANAAAGGDARTLHSLLGNIEERHHAVISDLFPGNSGLIVREHIHPALQQLRDFCDALLQLRSLTPQLLDVALPLGEKMSAQIFAAALSQLGLRGSYVDASEILITDDRFGDASVDMEETRSRTRQKLGPLLDSGHVPVVTGYCGSTRKRQPTTLGRGGSDTSGTILGAALQADEVWIWTDVDGILTADPRICHDARVLPEITFREAIELSYYGAKVIHRKAVSYAMDMHIPVRIKNSFKPDFPGTKITAASAGSDGRVRAVTATSNTTLVSLCIKNEFHLAAEILGRLFPRLGHDCVDVLFAMQSSAENSVGLVLRGEDTDRVLASIDRLFHSELKQGVIESLEVERELTTVAVMGENLKRTPELLGRLFTAVSRCGVSVVAAAQGANELSVCFAVSSKSVADVVRSIHNEFFPIHLSDGSDERSTAWNELSAEV